MRVVTLLPAATEIVAALGFADALVGVSHECDWPPEVNDKPRVTRCEIYGKGLPSGDVDRWVNRSLAAAGTIYTIDAALLHRLEPDVIVTQQLCDVCAIDYTSVIAIANALPRKPRIVNLSPASLSGIFDDIRRVAASLEAPARGESLIGALEGRAEAVRARASAARSRPRCVQLEWIVPPFCGGHWNPELVEIAGGIDPLGRKGAPSAQVAWDSIVEARPEVLAVACCGYDLERTLADLRIAQSRPGWESLPAVRDGRVYAIDGSAYFSRPGPRVVDALEILAEIIHPELFAGRFPGRDFTRLTSRPTSKV
jgi:iron complex transport system substrate-binding protein